MNQGKLSAHLYELGAMISPDLETDPTSALISTLPCPCCFTCLPCTSSTPCCSLLPRRPCLPVSTLPQLILSSFLMFDRPLCQPNHTTQKTLKIRRHEERKSSSLRALLTATACALPASLSLPSLGLGVARSGALTNGAALPLTPRPPGPAPPGRDRPQLAEAQLPV